MSPPRVRTMSTATGPTMLWATGPLVEKALVDLDAEPRAVEREDRAVRVAHRRPNDVTGEQQRPKEFAAPRDGCCGEGQVQVCRGAERGFDHASDVGTEA